LNLRALLLVAAICAASCTRPTSILLVVDGDLEPGVDVDVLSIEIRSGGAPLWAGVTGLDGEDELPQTLRILPGEGGARTVEIAVEARLDDEAVVTAMRQLTFQQGREVQERICLYRRCADSPASSCLQGECNEPPPADGDADADADADTDCDEDRDCDDEDPCNGEERCVDGACEGGEPLEIDDGVDCTVDSCDAAAGVIHEPNDDACDDGDDCTTDRCESSGCTRESRDEDGDGHIDETCAGGDDCDDGDPLVGPERPEVCGNLVDDDCDGLVDFEDDCPSGESCAEAIPLVLPATYHGSNAGRPDTMTGSCGGDGGEVFYSLELEVPSSVHVDTTGGALDTVLYAASPTCAAGDELLCDEDNMDPSVSRLDLLEVPAGTYYFVVDGAETSDSDTFAMAARWAPVGCGNGLLESGEGCDDGNSDPGDSCSATCERLGTHALLFDGIDDVVRVRHHDSLSLVGPFTVELWFRLDEPLGGERVLLLRKGLARANFYLWIWDGGFARAGTYHAGSGSSVDTTTVIDDDAWHHLAMTYDRTRMRIFLDGVLEGTTTTPGGDTDLFDADIFIGRPPTAWTARTLPGAIDDLRISSVDRYGGVDFTPDRRHPLDDDVVALFRFDEGSGDLSADESPNRFLGLVTGCDWEAE